MCLSIVDDHFSLWKHLCLIICIYYHIWFINTTVVTYYILSNIIRTIQLSPAHSPPPFQGIGGTPTIRFWRQCGTRSGFRLLIRYSIYDLTVQYFSSRVRLYSPFFACSTLAVLVFLHHLHVCSVVSTSVVAFSYLRSWFLTSEPMLSTRLYIFVFPHWIKNISSNCYHPWVSQAFFSTLRVFLWRLAVSRFYQFFDIDTDFHP